jgi:hypothetical protein
VKVTPIRFDGPSLDISVKNRLRRLDPRLVVTWSPYALDPATGLPIEHSGTPDTDPLAPLPKRGEPIKDPAFYLWLKDDARSTHWLVSIYQNFGHEQLMHLEDDVVRRYGEKNAFEVIAEKSQQLRDRALARKANTQRAKREANESRIHDLVFEGKSGYREAKVSSYKGQTSRQSSAERGRFLSDAREDGWELPEQS